MHSTTFSSFLPFLCRTDNDSSRQSIVAFSRIRFALFQIVVRYNAIRGSALLWYIPRGNLLSPAQTQSTVLIGKKEHVQQIISSKTILTGYQDDASECLAALIESIEGGTGIASTLLPVDAKQYHRFTVGLLPDKVSRNNHPLSVHKITEMVASTCRATNDT